MNEFFYSVTGGHRPASFRTHDAALREQEQRVRGVNRTIRRPKSKYSHEYVPVTNDDRGEMISRIMVIQLPLPLVPDLSEYPEDQATAIRKAVLEYRIEEMGSGRLDTDWSDRIVQRGQQRFAVFGPTAYKLYGFDRVEDEGTIFEYQPVIIGGRMFRADPEEGAGGMLYLMRCLQRKNKANPSPKWMGYLAECGWLRTDELGLSNEEIMENIAAEIDRGENAITKKPAGWA
jgi:hypothetical protein